MQIRFLPTARAIPRARCLPARCITRCRGILQTLTTRTSRAAALIVVAGCIAGLQPGCKAGSGGGGSAAPVELGHYENAIKVTPTLDTTRAVTQVIGFAGGTISATAADGTVYTLVIPADSLRQVTRITMTPVTKLDGLPFGNGSDVTVDLQPSGLLFDVPATLSIAPATPIPDGEQILYGYSDDTLVFAEPALDARGIVVVVPHFSGYGVAKGLMGDVEEVRKQIGGSAEQRIYSEIRAVMQAAAQAEARGETVNLSLEPYYEQLNREVIQPRWAAAGQSCAAGTLAMQSRLNYARELQLELGHEEGDDLHQVAKLYEGTIAPKCMTEEYEMCVSEHIVHRIAAAYMATSRQLVMLGIEDSPILGKMKKQVDDCLHFDLEFKVHTRFEFDTRTLNQSYLSFAESTALETEVAFSLDRTLANFGHTYFEPSSGPMQSLNQVYRQKAPGCIPGTVSNWSDTGHFLAMNLVTDPPDLIEGGGGIKEIEVELGLPSPMVTISGMSCSGVSAPAAAELAGAPAAYLLNHGDGFIRDWKVQGSKTAAGQTFVTATAEWSNLNGLNAMTSVEDVGIATLRHTPR